MKFGNELAIALLTLLSNDVTRTFAQYVTTITVSINTDPFCTSSSGLEVPGTSGGGAGGSVFGPVSGVLNGSASGTGSSTNGSPTLMPMNSSTGQYKSLGYYATPADGNLLGGPVFTNPLMTLELCGTDCQGYSYLALENGDECNCGSSAPSGPSYSSPPSKNKRQVAISSCTLCGGNSAECCGAPGYALVYQILSNAESSLAVVYSTTNSAGPVIKSSSTSSSPISSGSVVAYTSTSGNQSIVVGSTSSYVALMSATTSVYNISTSGSSRPPGTTSTYAQISAATYNYSSNNFTTSTFVPITTAPTGSGNGSSSGFSSITNSTIPSTSSLTSSVTASSIGNGTSSATSSSTGNITGSATSSGTGNITGFATGSGTGNITSFATGSGSSGLGSYSNYTFSNSVLTSASTTTAERAGITPAAHGGGIGATTTTNDAAEPTVDSPAPSCVQSAGYVGNNTKYTDYFGYTYDIRCNLNVKSTTTDYEAHAESFEDCLEYCSLLEDCIAVNYQDPPYTPSNTSNCYPQSTFGGYAASGTDGVYSGVNVDGASDGTLNNQNLCTSDNNQGMSYAGPPASTYTDDYGLQWTIGCDNTLDIISRAALSSTVTDTLASCVDYCSRYESCEMINWTGPHTSDTANGPNCFPASSTGATGAAGSAPGAGYAVLNPSSD